MSSWGKWLTRENWYANGRPPTVAGRLELVAALLRDTDDDGLPIEPIITPDQALDILRGVDVTDFNKTLDELWKEAGEKPFLAEAGDGDVVRVLGKRTHGESVGGFIGEVIAVAGSVNKPGTVLIGMSRSLKIWRLHVEAPKPVPHWPAVTTYEGKLFATGELYADDTAARAATAGGCSRFVRLATEYPPIMLVPEAKK